MKALLFKNQLNYDLIKRSIKWHVQYYLFRRGKPLHAGVYLTDACNSRCIMCNIWKKKPHTYPRADQEAAINSLARAGCYYYTIGGGEPTLVKDFIDRLSYAARNIPYVRTVTNGFSMTPELARAIGSSGIKEITLSIDGTKEFHNTMRGRADAFEKAWNALDMLCTHAPDVQVVINSIITPYNLDSLKELGKCLNSLPQVNQKYLPLTFHDIMGVQDLKSLPLSMKPAAQADIETFLDNAISDPRILNSDIFLKKAKNFFKGEKNLLSEQKRCLYAYHAIEYDSRGYAYSCLTGMGFKNGVPPGHSLETYFDSSEYSTLQKKLESCAICQKKMMLCYFEPRLNFPLHNLLRYMF